MEPEDMEEPTQCDDCGEYFDAALPENWNSIPFYIQCPHCQHKMRPERDNYND